MPAVVARRLNSDLEAKYDQLIGSGSPPKLAITAVMRSLFPSVTPGSGTIATSNQRRLT
jgi:hypothetical protein